MKPLPRRGEMHRVPSGYWKVVATPAGRMSAFIFNQNTARRANYCNSRVTLVEVQPRRRLMLFPMMGDKAFASLDADLGCMTSPPAPAIPAEITTR